MKMRSDFVTNSSSASFIIATNLEADALIRKIVGCKLEQDEKKALLELLCDNSKQLDAHKMSSVVADKLGELIPLDEDDDDIRFLEWKDKEEGNIRYKNIFVYKEYQFTREWSALMDSLSVFRNDEEVYCEMLDHWGT